ncbi:hypothetical protein [Actinophytocola sp. NPDC049390]|uniref:hypothetical protein n=1 Tax=Actinophytocola sp. NPDC049390 TaxID=3363894 RepID=UPI00378AC1E5
MDNEHVDAYTTGRARLVELIESARPGVRNEDTTRFQIIDQLLLSVLGWQPEDIETESYEAGDYVDYAIGKPATRAILEAKREGIHFDFPAGSEQSESCAVKSLVVVESTKRAVEQVIRYCQTRGVPVAILCNGAQFIAFLASRQDGISPLEGKAVLFHSLEDIRDRFREFWDFFSKDGFALSNLQRFLASKQSRKLPPEKLSQRILNYPGFRSRTGHETDLKILGELFLQDLQNEREVSDEFLRDCYTPAGALPQYAAVSKEILRTRYEALKSHVSSTESVYQRTGVSAVLRADTIAATLSSKPVVLLGDVGVGKTIFIRHLIRIEAAEMLDDAIVLYVDFGREPTFAAGLDHYVTQRLLAQLRDVYELDLFENRLVRAVYNSEINRFKRSPSGVLAEDDPREFRRRELDMLDALMNDSAEHVRRCLEHLRATAKRLVVIVLDNVDQRPVEFQEAVFLIAQSFAQTWPAAVFLALRPTTFYESKSSGSLAAYQPRVFTVTPARSDEVIQRRLRHARKQLADKGRLDSFPSELHLNAPNLVKYLDVLIDAFQDNAAIKELFENLSGGNLRIALDLLGTFVGSGYVSTARILDADRYDIPMHEVIRAITFGEFDYYDPSKSVVANLFDITSDDGREHFLLPSLLVRAQRSGETAGRSGYIEIAELYDHGISLGFDHEVVGQHLERAFSKRLLESKGYGPGAPCRITTVGAYMHKEMVHKFSYVDAMVVDTPVVSLPERVEIRVVWAILDRLDRAAAFRSYLDSQWKLVDRQSCEFDWSYHSLQLLREITFARTRAERAAANYDRET